ncbi:DNA-binding response regulator [Halomicronema hongdechloris C2206]|uniref:DNA-binding response regulator n=1 Tax=Halomicronema hongdechloris C2206 TaxID=1641165 RepID=A0A1Z3HJG1_9CYAN|nr:response regulator [Halomicronema hongdechloris]ASC70452.1 DNA-binding response regulator [Halomicronema hongdechloris C2206]
MASDGDKGLVLAQGGGYDLLILDWMLPQLNGVEICRQVRSQGDSTPVLFLTAKDTVDDRVAGLDAGGDDYLVKPFELRELLARGGPCCGVHPPWKPAPLASVSASKI